MGPCPPVTPKNCLAPRGISVLEKLVKTCPVWLQLGLGRAEAARILHREATGVSRGSLHLMVSGAGTATGSCALAFLAYVY